MRVTDTSQSESLIMKARGLTVVHQIDEAETLYQQILQTEPDTTEALNFVAMRELGRGDFAPALQRLQHALELAPEESDLWKNFGIALLAVGRAQDAVDAFDRVISMEPKLLPPHLHRAAAFERMGKVYEATAAYDGVLTLAQHSGRWRNQATTPAELRPVVHHAMRYVAEHRQQLFLDLLAPVRARYGAAALARVEAGLADYVQRAADEDDAVDVAPRHCSFFEVPGLAGGPFLAADAVPGVAQLAAEHALLREELDAALAGHLGVEPYFGTHNRDFLRSSGALDGGPGARLEAYFLWRRGEPERFGQRTSPHSVAAVAALPQAAQVRVQELGPDVFFVILAPETHVLPSTGITNARISVEIPLRTSGRCVRRAGGLERPWQVGAGIAYDPSYAHELTNAADGVSAALVLDAWHPDLSAAERAALALLFDGIRQYNADAQVAAPF